MNQTLQYKSRAKINWWLKVGDVRSDGYHELETVFQELEIGDLVTISMNDSDRCNLSGFPADILPEQNLVTKAWEIMKSRSPNKIHGVDFSITKTIPHGGGLGGGSANAACMINGLNSLFDLRLSVSKLQKIGGIIGSDVAFFTNGGTAIGRGRGELIEQLPPSPTYWIVLLMPESRMSTPEAYRILDGLRQSENPRAESHTLSNFLTNLHSGAPAAVAPLIQNDFEMVADGFPWFAHCKNKLIAAGALRAFLCGSGSTVAGLAQDEIAAARIAEETGGIFTSTRVYS